ncbi:ATP-binding cassette domain-containing protein [Amycolatopsis echigonensis]|uniref:ATP-binding cassette domain-containing protein n=1 Tax=Amycolatopsis echigonensis TaxID=2576905 RepID=A0A8E1W354_9PSEU|nr:ATP-binding cassette domain-containing protein [Amycolatopsis niigatensis]MBB2503092.1 ATP-binding cassette domain-containing protein [Amycolatopsis echigonensis]
MISRGGFVLITPQDLGVTAGETALFSGLDLAVDAGECLVVRGANGAGKSTLLRCLYGNQAPTSGSVSVCGGPPDERSAAFRRRVSVLFDDSALFDELTPRQHLDLLRNSFGGELADGPVPAPDVPASELSAGQRRRLLLHAAVARPHEVLLLDEPERALDAAGRAWLSTLVTTSTRRGAAVVVASHHPPLADEVADYVVDL